MLSLPVVSCVMPTADRGRFVPRAVEQFLAQDHEARELIVLDDGVEPVGDLIPDDPRIRYERLPARMVLGAKRNLGCEMAQGEIIAHWDDDDWYAQQRLRVQVEALQAQPGALLCGLSALLFRDPSTGRTWRYTYPASERRPWVAGASMLYRRTLWERTPFRSVMRGEDTRFAWAAARHEVVMLRDDTLMVATVHDSNTSSKRMRSSRWQQVDQRLLIDAEVPGLAAATVAPVAVGPNPPVEHPPQPATVPSGKTNPATGSAHVTVSIPYHGCAEFVARAVESVLAQTHRELTAVVVNDGDATTPPWPALAHIDDPRLVRFDLGANRGRYFADEVVLRATSSPYLAVQDADDWSEPDRIERLLTALQEERAGAAVSAFVLHDHRRASVRTSIVRWPKLSAAVGPELVHRAGHQALYDTEALRAVGGWYAGFRIGYDTAILNLMAMTTLVASVDAPLYHQRVRSDSLTQARATGHGSAMRKRVTSDLRELQRNAYGVYARHAGNPSALVAGIRHLIHELVADADSFALEDAAKRLRRRLEHGTRRVTAVVPRPPDVYEVLARLGGEPRAWSISDSGAIELSERLRRRRPRRILEVGSGKSTVVLAAHVARHGGTLVTLEHDRRFFDRTAALLRSFGLRDEVELRLAPLRAREWEEQRDPWYATELEGTFDFFVVDGPPLPAGGRGAAFPAVAPHRDREWEMWLFDADRRHEQECLRQWKRHFRLQAQHVSVDDTGVFVITELGRGTTSPPAVPSTLGISILGGGRPELLRRTVESFSTTWPGVLEASNVTLMINGPDAAGRAYAESLNFVDRLVSYEESVLTIGAATSYVVATLLGDSTVRFLLHLEDDWEAITMDVDALARAKEVLDTDPTIGQVRLRHRSERVLDRHMVTGAPILWEDRGGYLRSTAHFTFNPSLMRIDDVATVFPVQHERDAQARFLRTGMAVAQLTPAVFRHIGGADSRRKNLRRT